MYPRFPVHLHADHPMRSGIFSSTVAVLPFRKRRIVAFSSLLLLTLGMQGTSLFPATGWCNIPVKNQETLPVTTTPVTQPTPEHAGPVKGSFVHMRDFFKNVTSYFGISYRYGGETPDGFDCSGFVRFMYSKVFNLDLPRSSREMATIGTKIGREELMPGDLVFFHSLKKRQIDHVGIFIGNDTFIHSSVSKGITEDQLQKSYFNKRFAGAVRILDVTPDMQLSPGKATFQRDALDELLKPS